MKKRYIIYLSRLKSGIQRLDKLWMLGFSLGCISIFAAGCGKEKIETGTETAIPVKVMEVRLKDIQNTLDYVGDIKAQDEAEVFPKVSGKIAEKLKEDGAGVNKGDIIAYIDRDEVGFSYEKAPIESPLSGIIGRVYVDKGMSVNAQTAVALVVDMDKVKIELNIPEKYLHKVSLEQVAHIGVDAYPDKTFTGNVTKISPVVDLDTRTAPIEIIIPNEEHFLKPGMFARVRLVIEEHKDVPVILKEAILGDYVYVVSADIAQKRDIKRGIQKGADVEVTEGLKAGDLVVIMGQQRLQDGVGVIVEKE